MDIQEARRAVGRVNRSAVQDGDFFPLAGGLNIVQTPLQMAPGELLDGVNYEPSTLGGYTRIQGYERLDGHQAPSQTEYYVLNFFGTVPGNFPVITGSVFGGTFSSTAIVVAIVLDQTGLNGYFILMSAGTVVTFVDGEIMRSNPTPGVGVFGSANGNVIKFGFAATNPALDAVYRIQVREARRQQVLAVPGSGPILGVVEYNGVVYAFRNNVGGTAAVMYRADPVGWTALPASNYPVLAFNAGSVQFNVGEVIVGATSGATATVVRVVLQGGDWGAGTAQGQIVLINVSGVFTVGENLTHVAVVRAVVQTAAITPVLLPNGKYDFCVTNFYGTRGTIRLYGCDGLNRAFEFQDGAFSFFYQINSGIVPDRPTHVAQHRGRLWLAFPGGSVQPSGINDAAVFSALQGAAELGVGFPITGLLGEMSPSQSAFYSTATLFIFTPQQTFTITGDGPNWILGPYAVDTGGIPFSVQRLGQGMFLNDRGFATFQAVQQLGNFTLATVSQKIQSLIPEILANAVCSSISKNKSLYRLFLNDGRYIAIGFKDLKVTGITICDLGEHVNCAWAGNTTTGAELLLAGGVNGYVYQLDSGVQFDGAQMTAFLHTAFHFSKTPSRLKRYRRAQLDIQASGPCTLQFAPDYSYGSADVGSDAPRTLATIGAPPDPGELVDFSWSNGLISAPTFKLEGSGTNVGTVVFHQSTNEQPHTIQGLTLHKSLRRLDRGSQL